MKDERFKQLMDQVGMPNSMSVYGALEQVANEVAQGYIAKNLMLKRALRHEAAQLLKARCCIEDAELDELIRASALRMIDAVQE